MAHVNLPNLNQNGQPNDFNDVQGNDLAITAQVNGQLDSTNLANNAVTESKIGGLAVSTGKLQDGSVTAVKILNGNVTGAKLADDVVGVYRTLKGNAGHGSGLTAASVFLTGPTYGAIGGGGSFDTNAPDAIYLDDASYAVIGRTTQLRVRAQVMTNAAPGVTFTFGLYPIVNDGDGTWSLGTVVSGSTAAIASPAADSTVDANSGDFAVPADGLYALGRELSGIPSDDPMIFVQLEIHHV